MLLDPRQTVLIAVMVLFLGRYLNKKIDFFRRYSIPEPVTGGVIASILFSFIYIAFDIKIDFSLEHKNTLKTNSTDLLKILYVFSFYMQ